MLLLQSSPRPAALARLPALPAQLATLKERLHTCQATLQQYIAEKRTSFPRFFFLSDDDLLELLGQARATSATRDQVLRTHIRKLFPGASGARLGPHGASITALTSHYGEALALDTPVDIDAPVEVWLRNLESQMKQSLHTCIMQCISNKDLQDTLTAPTQVLCLSQNIRFTSSVEQALVSRGLHAILEGLQKDLAAFVKAGLVGEEDGRRGKVQALVLQIRHQISVVEELIQAKASSLDHWSWQKQLRLYVENRTNIVSRMGLASLPYTYEYLGEDTATLVRTHLTDQCFLLLTQALHLGQAGNPFGPAGTGKTESVKALGGLLGRLVLVFNCDEGMDITTFSRLLQGLSLVGAWGCFDEFNRLQHVTLAAVTRPLAALLSAVAKHDKTADIDGKECNVNVGCGVFATMNPAVAGYGGRRALPGALAPLLRPCAMWRPLPVDIAGALLAAQGFSDPKQVAEKLVTCTNMASCLLSPQQHYDWGLRALKSVLGSCGAAVRQHAQHSGQLPTQQQQQEYVLRAIRINTLPRLTYTDKESFESLLKVVFPGVEAPETLTQGIEEALLASYEANKLTVNENQMRKCVELYSQLQQRMGVVLVGPPGCGKSTLRLLLKHALIRMGKNVVQSSICPKAMSRSDLLGHIDHDTRQWEDGVISTAALSVTQQPQDVWSWVVLDGDVDPEWIESLNSVLDDNRLLTLPSGWRIQFSSNVNFIFETHDLSFASPATITRMGIILISEEECCYRETIQSWSSSRALPEEMRSLEGYSDPYPALLQRTTEQALQWTTNNQNELVVPYHTIAMVRQVLSFFDDSETTKMPEEVVAIAFAKGLQCMVKPRTANVILEQVSSWTGVSPHALTWSQGSLGMSLLGQSSSDLHSFMGGSSPLLSSARMTSLSANVHTWMDAQQHFMIIGPPASGKSFILKHLLKEARDCTVVDLQCTPVFDHRHIIQALKQKSALTAGGTKSSGRLVLVIRSLHRAHYDEWNSCLVQAFLLQLVQHAGCWERSDEGGMRWLSLPAFLLIVTATQADSALSLCPRFTNSMRIAYLEPPDEKELSEICSYHVQQILQPFVKSSKDRQRVDSFSSAMFGLYREAREVFISEVHYNWTARDLTTWCDNLKSYKVDEIDNFQQAILQEAVYIFRDRLVSLEEKKKFDMLCVKYLGIQSLLDLCFVPRMAEQGTVLELVQQTDWKMMVNKVINQCNSEVESTDGAFGVSGAEPCVELLDLVSACGRSLGGRAVVMAGAPGVGRRAAGRLAAEMATAKLCHIATQQQFNAQIRTIISSCGLEGSPTLVVIEEGASQSGPVLGALEALLTGSGGHGSLPLTPQEVETLAGQARAQGNTIDNFINYVHKNLGIVFILDTKDPKLRNLLQKYSLLYQRCHFVWLDRWSDDTIREMPSLIANRMSLSGIDIGAGDINIPLEGIIHIYSSVSQADLATPYRYISLLKTYFNIYTERKRVMEDKQKILQSGVTALTAAQEEVSRLKAGAAGQQAALSEKQNKAAQALNQIAATMQAATGHKEQLQTLRASTQVENDKLQARKKVIEAELSEVEPIIQEARSAVGEIRNEALSEVRSLRAPPEPVRDVLEAVLRLMDIADTSWHSMKMFLSRRGIKEDIRNFSASNISADSLSAVQKLISQRSVSFTEKAARRASVACAPLAAWVLANIKYAEVLHKIAPLEAEQRSLSRNLAEASNQMESLSEGLTSVDSRVTILKEQLNSYTREATQIELSLTEATNTITTAEQLVDRLKDEYQRWINNLKDLSQEVTEISVRSLLAAGFISYLSNQQEEQRMMIMKSWGDHLKVNMSSFTIKDFLATNDDQIQWTTEGLPPDITALHSAIIINEVLKESRCGLVPLIIDPNGGVTDWLDKHLSNTPKDIVPQGSEKFKTLLQHAIRFGKVFIIDHLTYIDNSWLCLSRGLPLSLQASSSSSSTPSPGFRLLLVSRDTSLPERLSPHHRALLSIVDFTPQKQGLADQLVHEAVKQEEPKLLEQLMKINADKNKLQMQQSQLQATLLHQLSSGDILHNAPLLESLEQTQKAGAEITAALQRAREGVVALDKRCETYRDVAATAAAACLATQMLKDKLARQSQAAVTSMFLQALRQYKTDDGLSITRGVVSMLLERVLAALPKDQHCSTTVYLLHLVYPHLIPTQEWDVLISSPNVQTHGKPGDGSISGLPSWITPECHQRLRVLQSELPELFSSLNLSSPSWSSFSASGEYDSIPAEARLTAFQKSLIVWALRPEKLYTALTKTASQILGVSQLLVSGDLLGAASTWAGPELPVLVVSSRGTDPTDQITARAANIVGEDKCKQVWVSSASSSDLLPHLQWHRSSGAWLIVSLSGVAWSAAHSHIVTAAVTGTAHPQSRLWIIAEDAEVVPALLAAMCVNIYMEAPSGIRNNMLRTLSLWAPSGGRSKSRSPQTTRLQFSLALCHSVMLERTAYIPQGWRTDYGFSWGDAQAGLAALSLGAQGGAGGQSGAVGGLCGALYGGRATCHRDARLAQALAERHFQEEVVGHAWKPLGLDIRLPMSADLKDYLPVLSEFPLQDSPSQLSLPNNVHKTKEHQAASNVITQLKSHYFGAVSPSQSDGANWKKQLSPLMALWKKLNSGADSLVKAKISDIKVSGGGGGVQALCVREWEAAVLGVRGVHTDLSAVRTAPNNHTTQLLIADKTPPSWLYHWPGGPSSAQAFLLGLVSRAASARAHALSLQAAGSPAPPPQDRLLRPARALPALLWDAARKLNVPPEQLTTVTKWGEEEGAYVLRDLWLEGAVWEGDRLVPCRTDTHTHSPAPPIAIHITRKDSSEARLQESCVELPMYTSKERCELVGSVRAPAAQQFSSSLWLLNATALIIS